MNILKKREKSATTTLFTPSTRALVSTSATDMEMQSFSTSEVNENFIRPQSLDNYNGRKQTAAPSTARGSRSVSSINPNNLHETLVKTFEKFYTQESQTMIAAIEQSREEMRESVLEFFEEQSKYKEQLVKASEGRYTFKRRKENAIPLSEYIRRKKETLDPERAKSQAVEGQHPSDRAAVEKYLRKRDRRKVAEKNQQNRQVNEEQLQTESKKIIQNLQGMDLNVGKERDRQAEILKQKLEEKKNRKDVTQIASDIIDNYQDSELAQERERLAQKEKLEARLSAVRKVSAVRPDSSNAVAQVDI